jgi:hypothetical protein
MARQAEIDLTCISIVPPTEGRCDARGKLVTSQVCGSDRLPNTRALVKRVRLSTSLLEWLRRDGRVIGVREYPYD